MIHIYLHGLFRSMNKSIYLHLRPVEMSIEEKNAFVLILFYYTNKNLKVIWK